MKKWSKCGLFFNFRIMLTTFHTHPQAYAYDARRACWRFFCDVSTGNHVTLVHFVFTRDSRNCYSAS